MGLSIGQFIQQNPPVSRTGSVSTITPKPPVDKMGPSKDLGPRPSYTPPKPTTGLDLSDPKVRQQELSSISDPQTLTRSKTQLETIKLTGASQQTKDCVSLLKVMDDKKFNSILKHFSPPLGERFLQAFGKSKGSIDGGRFKKTMLKMLPMINIGSFGRDAARAQKMKTALSGILHKAEKNNNHLAMQLAQALGAHEKSKRNTQIIGGVVSVVTSALSFVPGISFTSGLGNALGPLGSRIGGSLVSSLGLKITGTKLIESGVRTLAGSGVEISSSFLQDKYTTGVDRDGRSVGKEKTGTGHGKLKVQTRQLQDRAVLQAEMGYETARALINYLGPAQGPDEPDNSPRMELRRSLGALDPSKTYTIAGDKIGHREEIGKMAATEGHTDYLQLFFDIGVKGASARFEEEI